MSVVSALLMLTSYLASAVSAYGVLQFAAGPNPSLHSRVRIAVISLGLGPLLISSIVAALLSLAPGLTPALTIAFVVTALVLCAALGLKHHRTDALRVWSTTVTHLCSFTWREPVSAVGAGALSIIILLIVVPAVVVPLAGNDALEYAGAAKRVFLERSTAGYPFVHPTDADGFYGPWSHPLGYVGLQVWGFLIQGSAAEAGVIKLITPYFAFCTAFAVIHAIGGARRPLAPWAAAVLLATPAYIFTTMQSHIDQLRIFPLIAAFLALPLIVNPIAKWRGTLLLGGILGAGLFTHSIGALSCVLLGFALLVILKIPIWKRLVLIAGVTLVALFMNAPRLAINLSLYGTPIADIESVPVFGVDALNWNSFLRETRGIAALSDRWISGVLAGLTRPDLFGGTYWIFIAAIILLLLPRFSFAMRQSPVRSIEVVAKPFHQRSTTRGLLLGVLVFEAMIALSVLLGMDTFIKNYRYMMTTLPLVVVFSFRVLSPWAATLFSASRSSPVPVHTFLLWLTLAVGVAVTVLPVGYFSFSRLRLFELHHLPNLLLSDTEKLRLSRLGQLQMLGFEPWQGMKQVRVLTLRQAEFAFYAKVAYIVDLDPRLLPFYAAQDADEAFLVLRNLGITHVSVPPEATPTLYNSALQDIVSSGRYVERRDYFGTTTLVQLNEHAEAPRTKSASEFVFDSDWAPLKDGPDHLVPDPSYVQTPQGRVMHNNPFLAWRAGEKKLASGAIPISHHSARKFGKEPNILRANEEYILMLDLEGSGEVIVEIVIGGGEKTIPPIGVWHGVLDGRSRPFAAHFSIDLIPEDCHGCELLEAKIVVRLLSRGAVRAGSISLKEAGYHASPGCRFRGETFRSDATLHDLTSHSMICAVPD